MTTSIKCECDHIGKLVPGWENTYDATTERPFVNHQPGECRCTNNLRRFVRDGKTIWLCSCCCMSGDQEVK